MRKIHWIALTVLVISAGFAVGQSPIAPPANLAAPVQIPGSAAADTPPPPPPQNYLPPQRPLAPPPANEYGSATPPPAQGPLIGDMPPPVFLAPSHDRFWVGVGILLGWSERSQLPSALTVPATGTTIGIADNHRNTDLQAGLILNGGFWFDDDRKNGIDASFYNIGDWYERYDPTVLNTPIGQFNQADATVNTQFASVDVNFRHNFYASNGLRVDGLIGYRYAQLWETTDIGTIIPDPDFGAVRFRDHANTTNDFNGGQLGLAMEYKMGLWSFNATGKVALGGVHEQASFDGASAVAILNGAPGTIPNLSTTQFAVLPSASFMLSRQLWGHSRAFIGYEFQYLSRAVRSNDVYESLATGLAPKANSGFWTQGITLGMEWRY